MKKILYVLFLLLMNIAIHARSSQALDGGANDGPKEQQGSGDECLLVAINCGDDYLALEQKIEALQNEISKGSAVYSGDELRNLRKQLDNANKTLKFFEKEGAGKWYKYPGE